MSHRVLAVLIVIGLVVAGVTYVQAQRTYFWALLSTPMAGAPGTSWADLPPPEIRAEGRARAQALYAEARWTARVSFACAALLAGIPVAAWRNRRDVRSWHWLSFLGVGLLVATATLGYLTSLNGPRRAGLLALGPRARAGGMRARFPRGKYGAPGRPVAWVTLLLSLLFGFVLLSDA